MAETGKKRLIDLGGDKYMWLQYIDEHGLPIYYTTDNLEALQTSYADQSTLRNTFGVSATGENMVIVVWDGGLIKFDHVELEGRVTQKDQSPEVDNHATHVTGTILASGVNELAIGVAPRAEGSIYNFSNDLPEMSAEAADGLIVSNHSYGPALGWLFDNGAWTWVGDTSISRTEDYRFGYYSQRTQSWDRLAYNNPFYTIVTSTGNHRSDVGDGSQPADGPFDCLGSTAIAKTYYL